MSTCTFSIACLDDCWYCFSRNMAERNSAPCIFCFLYVLNKLWVSLTAGADATCCRLMCSKFEIAIQGLCSYPGSFLPLSFLLICPIFFLSIYYCLLLVSRTMWSCMVCSRICLGAFFFLESVRRHLHIFFARWYLCLIKWGVAIALPSDRNDTCLFLWTIWINSDIMFTDNGML